MNSPSEPVPEEPEHEEVIERLHAELASQLERIAWSMLRDWQLAADAVQEAFALFAQKLADIPTDHRRGWLVKTVQYQSQNLRRTQQRADDLVQRFFKSGLVRESVAEYRAGKCFDQVDEHERLRQAIEDLPASQRTVVRMRLGEERSFAEIASDLDVPLGTVLSRMRLAMEKLRTRLKP